MRQFAHQRLQRLPGALLIRGQAVSLQCGVSRFQPPGRLHRPASGIQPRHRRRGIARRSAQGPQIHRRRQAHRRVNREPDMPPDPPQETVGPGIPEAAAEARRRPPGATSRLRLSLSGGQRLRRPMPGFPGSAAAFCCGGRPASPSGIQWHTQSRRPHWGWPSPSYRPKSLIRWIYPEILQRGLQGPLKSNYSWRHGYRTRICPAPE